MGKSATAQEKQRPAPIDKELVKEFVLKSHSDLNRVKELFWQQPGLLNCSWDLGGGDFEAGLEAAGHVGNKEIAQFLLDNGARMNIFCAAMLGKIEIVKSILTAFPNLKTSKGPHGLQLLHHAKKGGDGAKEVLQYLESIGAQ
ncbi:MAG: ankyrin repeat domain-containing protein [Chitinophagaceae bacterium]|nr:ankyrin repeat domain-containing protein [Chitinophagaceae bacterium]